MPFARIDDHRIHYEMRGSGTPLLLVPGLPQISSDWFPFADSLVNAFTVIVYDNRGSGQSDEPEGWYSIESMARDALGLLDVLDIERTHVFGTSMGGMIAQELAISWGNRIDRLVLGCTHAGGRVAIPPGPDVTAAFSQKTEDWPERVRALIPFAFSPGFLREQPELVARFLDKKSRDEQSYSGYRKQYGAANRHDSADRLGKIGRPTLVLTGTQDLVVPPQNSRLLCERIPGARFVEIEGAGHVFFVEKPDATLRELLPFLHDEARP